MAKIKPMEGDHVVVDYVGSYENGEVFDTTERKGPLKFVIGNNNVMKIFEKTVLNLNVGEMSKIKLKPEESFGYRNEKYVQKVPRDTVEGKAEIRIGNTVMLQIPYSNKRYPSYIVGFDDETVTLDLNPPMAGKNVVFEIKLKEIIRDGKVIK